MQCVNCGKDALIHKGTGKPTKYCSKSCRSTYTVRTWRKAMGDVWRATHRAKMQKIRAQKKEHKEATVYGPHVSGIRSAQSKWRGKFVSKYACEHCGKVFERANHPRMAVYCSKECRFAASWRRKHPVKPKPKAYQKQCTGCLWRRGLNCIHPGVPKELLSRGSVSLRKSGQCPLTM